MPIASVEALPRATPHGAEVSESTARMAPRPARGFRRSIAALRVVAGKDMLSFVTLSPEEQLLIGRDEAADLRLSDRTVSKRHARLMVDAHGSVTVVDLESTNGTAVNGRAVRRTALRVGDQLEIGGVSLRLELLSTEEIAHLERVAQRLDAANRDPLTGLHARGFLEEELGLLADRCEQGDLPFTAIFVDVDNFKQINDRYGHAIGDEVLVSISRLLLLGLRDTDPVVRYGGEELLILLPASPAQAALEIADRLRRSLAEHDWARTAPGLAVTASFGVAMRQSGEPLKEWLRRADAALYRAKHAGRNRVSRADDLPDLGDAPSLAD